MKKDIEWLKEEIGDLPITDTVFISDGVSYVDSAVSVMSVYDLIDQLDEPEVLSQKWIGENVEYAYFDIVDGSEQLSSVTAIIRPKKLQNLIIPKQELPVIPQFVADYLEKAKKEIDLLRVFEIANGLNELDMWRKEYNWIRLYHLDFAKAWLSGYEVEEEQKYNVKIEGKSLSGTAGIFLYKQGDEVLVGDNFNAYYPEKDKFRFTEQEIKNFDPKYWAFRKPVDEVVGE